MYSEYFKVTSPHFGQWLVGLNKDQQQSLNDFSQNKGLPSHNSSQTWNATLNVKNTNSSFSGFLILSLSSCSRWGGFLQESPIVWCIERIEREQKKLVVLCCNGIASTQTLAIERSQCFRMISFLPRFSLLDYMYPIFTHQICGLIK